MAFWKKLGKGLLKVGKVAAPIALGATGVGLPAAMAVSAGLNALDKKTSGGSWKGALGAGALGAGTGALGAMGGAAMMGKGIGPSTGLMSKIMGQGGSNLKRGMSGLKVAGKFMNRPRQPRPPFTPGFNPNAPSPYGMMGGQQQMGPMMQNFRNRQSVGMMAPRANQFQNLGY